MLFGKRKTRHRGFTLIEALIFSLIFAVVAVNFFRMFTVGAKVLRDAKARIAAAQVANEKFEVLRNITYENLTTDAAHFGGHVEEDETAVRSGISFDVKTEIRYVDDGYDGTYAEGTDTRPQDYKQVEVTVSWGSGADINQVKMTTHMAPPGTEELYSGGILNIEIRQSDGTPVQGAQVSVRNATTNESIYSGTTLVDGKVYLIGLVAGDKLYKISVSKGGYESVVTMPPYNQTAYDPVDEHGSVVLAGIWSQTIIFDPLATIQLKTQDPLGNAIGNIDFSLEGGRKFGDTVPAAVPVYSYPETNKQSDASGTLAFTDKSPGKYIFKYPDPVTANDANYEFWKVDPSYGNIATNFFAVPGAAVDVSVLLIPKNVPSLFLKVVDQTDVTPISGASVTVKNESLSYERDALTDQFGWVYFPKNEGTIVPLQNVQYEVKVQATGYQDEQTNITVSNLTKQDIQIHP
jgi:type II secretory pathway pseudopilin PulG